MVIHNQIFDTFRAEQKEIDKAIKLLEKNGFNSLAVHRINNLNGDGVESLKNGIQSLADNHRSQSTSSKFRLNVDRVFSKTGFKTTDKKLSLKTRFSRNRILNYPSKAP